MLVANPPLKIDLQRAKYLRRFTNFHGDLCAARHTPAYLVNRTFIYLRGRVISSQVF